MRFNPKARLDTSQIDNRRGGGGGLGGAFGGGRRGGGLKLGGGGLVVLIIALVFGFNPGDILGGGSSPAPGNGGVGTQTDNGDFSNCKTGADANDSTDCALVGITNSVQGYWSNALPDQTGTDYKVIATTPFSGAVQTDGCGNADSGVGPFYCPVDMRVYLDTSFFKDMLQGQLGAKGGPFAVAYVIAHEYGHHIENQLGIMSQVRTQQGENSDSVKLELMADCLAGAWARNATTVPDANGEVYVEDLTQSDIADAIDSAKAVGDDRIQQRSGGRVDPDSWTHGSAEQRVEAFNVGLDQGTIKSCNLFN